MDPSEDWSTPVVEWAHRTFGKGTPRVIFNRMKEEWTELETAIDRFERGEINSLKVVLEIADVVICGCVLAACFGYTLSKELSWKFMINKGRRWRSNGDGTGQHIPENVDAEAKTERSLTIPAGTLKAGETYRIGSEPAPTCDDCGEPFKLINQDNPGLPQNVHFCDALKPDEP